MITVEVAYALPQKQVIISLTVQSGTTALQAILQSGLLLDFPELSVEHCKIGIFGKVVNRDAVLQALDRVEIYRPLIADPKQARRLRAALKNTVAEKNQAAKSGQQKRNSR
ncbi:MAG: RnfH family protein [Methylophilus sp.]|uniref:RnfH family protein n=1 Tax=Methylophilus sp. TaxID=29541 RepID=UPI003FA0E842